MIFNEEVCAVETPRYVVDTDKAVTRLGWLKGGMVDGVEADEESLVDEYWVKPRGVGVIEEVERCGCVGDRVFFGIWFGTGC